MIDPDENVPALMTLYGATMLSVQEFEHGLAFLSLVATTEDQSHAPTAAEEVSRVFDRWWAAYQKDAAGTTLHRRLNGRIPDDLFARLARFIRQRRNPLAHRFLIQHLRRGEGGPCFSPGTAVALLDTFTEAARLTEEMRAQSDLVRAGWTNHAPLSPEMAQWARDFYHFVGLGQVRAEWLEQHGATPRGE